MFDEENYQEPDLIEMTDEDGNTITMQVLDYFFYNGEEYAILSQVSGEENTAEAPEAIDCFVVHVRAYKDEETGEEMEELEPIEDAALEEKLIAIASTRLDEQDEEE